MMEKIKSYFLVIYNLVRIFLIKTFKSAKISGGQRLLMSRKAKLNLHKNSTLNLARVVSIRENANIEVCGNGYLSIGENSFVSKNVELVVREKVIIGNNTGLGPNTLLYDQDHDYKNNLANFTTKEVIIGDNCWIGGNCIILKGTVIGDNCVIAAGTVVKGNIPDNTLVINKQNLVLKEIVREKSN